MKGTRPLNGREWAILIKALPKGQTRVRNVLIIKLGVVTGFRITELLSIRRRNLVQAWKIVDYLSVPRRHMKKRREGRTRLIPKELRGPIKKWLRILGQKGYTKPNDFVFQSCKKGNRAIGRKAVWRIINTAARNAGLTGSIGTHSLRKTFAENYHRAARGDIMKTSRALGHGDIRTTTSYLSFMQEDDDRLVRAISKSLLNP